MPPTAPTRITAADQQPLPPAGLRTEPAAAPTDDVLAGQAAYTPRMLITYDVMVHRVTGPWIFRCPTRRLDEHYRRHVSANHLDVGIGTGFLLDRCRFPSADPRVALMDLNPATLAYSARRLQRYRPEVYRRNVLDRIVLDAPGFASIGLNYLMHCVPGAIEAKSVVFDHLKALMNPGAVLFGATVLQGGVRRNWAARRLMGVFNHHRIFSNRHDDLHGLRRAAAGRLPAAPLGCVRAAAAVALLGGG